jgi:amino acid adenylation domain-containing protein
LDTGILEPEARVDARSVDDVILPVRLAALAASQAAHDAILTPGSPAITFAALHALAATTRSRLAALGLGPRDRVAVVMPIGQAAAALTAAVASGVACLPLNPSYSGRELRLAFTDLRVRAVVAGRDCDQAAATAAELGLPVLVGEELIARRAGDDRGVSLPTADDTALLLHTSGTTARAKVVAISHRTLAGIARKLVTWFALQPEDRCLNLMPIYNAHGTEAALFPTLFSGGSLVCLPQFTTDAFFAALREFAPSWYTGGFTFNQAIATAIDEAPDRAGPSHLRFMRSGSGRLPAKARETLERAYKVPLIESYAMTEAGVITANPLPPGHRRPGTAGFPIAEDVAIVGAEGERLPAGKDGEIVIRGPLVASRYENDPDASAKAFRNGWLHTGDQGHFDDDGYLVVTGRIKEMINRGGDKISPLEVDSVLIAHPEVKEAVTFAMPHPTLGEEVCAAVVLRAGAAVNADGLKRYAATQLAPFKVPRLIKAVDAIPKTTAGKVARLGMHERLGLSNGVARRVDSREERRRSPIEAALTGLWTSLLKAERVGTEDDFFLLGGDSLLATRLVASVHDLFGVALPMRSMFADAATIAGMAKLIEAGRAAPRTGWAPAEEPAAAWQPLSSAQQRLWFLHNLEPESVEYNVPWALHLRGWLDRAALARAVDALIERHHAVRTRFVTMDGEPRQIVDDASALRLDFHDLSAGDVANRKEAVERLALDQSRRRFDLTRSPLLRACLVRFAAEDHVLIVTIHHIAFDRWSLAVFQDDLLALYAAGRDGRAPALPPLAIQYPIYAARQRRAMAQPDFAARLDYWRKRLAGVPAEIALPFDRPRLPQPLRRGRREQMRLEPELVDALRGVARRSGATLYMVLLAGLQALLHRYSGQTDFVVGSPIAGRTRSELEKLVGFFVNTLAMRADVSGDPTFRHLLGRLRETALDAYANQDVPFERLIEELKPERHPGRPPLVQVVFALQNVPVASRMTAGLVAESVELDNGASKFDLTVTMIERSNALDVLLSYDCDLFEAETIRRMGRHLRNILAAAAEDAERRVSTLPLLDPAERQQIVVGWNRTARSFPRDVRIEALFRSQARRTPQQMAVVADDLQLRYHELDALSDQWADQLIRHGARPGLRIALCLERSAAMIVAMLAVLKVGSAYVPLDPGQPPERMRAMLDGVEPALVVVDRQSAGALRLYVGPKLRVGAELSLTSKPVSFASLAGRAEDPACVLFTSGTSGEPKGVVIPHRAIARLVVNTNFVEFRADDVVAHAANPAFDAALLEVWGALLNGATAAVIPRNVLLSPAELGARIAAQRVSVMFLTTALFNEVARTAPKIFVPLRCLMFGGEPADPGAIRSVLGAGFRGALLNGYGPTEATTFATTFDVRRLAEDAERVPVGKPIANTQVYILDDRRNPVPVGVAGEIYLGGPGLALGYLDDSALTAEKFVMPEIEPGRPIRLYRTGDRGRYLADGTIDVLGRADDQVKIRGFRIEPGEIAANLRRHPAVQDAVVVVHGTRSARRLVAYAVAGPAGPVGDDSVRAFLRSRLPEYMMPQTITWCDRLPLGPTGKIDRHALPPPHAAASGAGRPRVAPRTLLENQLVAIWEELLDFRPIGITDDFFDCGGHSLLAVRLLHEIERHCGRSLPLATMFECRTIAHLALAVRSNAPVATAGLLYELKAGGTRAPFFFLHGDYINGGFYCRKIAEQLDAEQPMVA